MYSASKITPGILLHFNISEKVVINFKTIVNLYIRNINYNNVYKIQLINKISNDKDIFVVFIIDWHVTIAS